MLPNRIRDKRSDDARIPLFFDQPFASPFPHPNWLAGNVQNVEHVFAACFITPGHTTHKDLHDFEPRVAPGIVGHVNLTRHLPLPILINHRTCLRKDAEGGFKVSRTKLTFPFTRQKGLNYL